MAHVSIEGGFRREAWCTRIGNDISDLERDASFASVRLVGRAQVVETFERPDHRGVCVRVVRDERDLRRMSLSLISSFRVYYPLQNIHRTRGEQSDGRERNAGLDHHQRLRPTRQDRYIRRGERGAGVERQEQIVHESGPPLVFAHL